MAYFNNRSWLCPPTLIHVQDQDEVYQTFHHWQRHWAIKPHTTQQFNLQGKNLREYGALSGPKSMALFEPNDCIAESWSSFIDWSKGNKHVGRTLEGLTTILDTEPNRLS